MEESRTFLDVLVGRWTLSGRMGDVDLRQDVNCGWILGGTFLRMYFKSTTPSDNPTSNYEAVYHIGFNQDQDVYELHLLDTTEVPVDCVVGIGRLEGNRLPFLFKYEETDFFNVFSWHPGEDRWSILQTFEENGETKPFAMKELVRNSG